MADAQQVIPDWLQQEAGVGGGVGTTVASMFGGGTRTAADVRRLHERVTFVTVVTYTHHFLLIQVDPWGESTTAAASFGGFGGGFGSRR